MSRKVDPLEAIRLDVPFAAEPPTLVDDSVGLSRIIRRAAGSYRIDVTLLDASDGRLLRDGIVVAHRVIDGLGEWYLSAPGWQPDLPAEQVEPVGANGDLPESFARLLQPFRRGVPFGPIAALGCERGEWALRADNGAIVADVRDEKVTVRRSGITTARYREITIRPTQCCSPAHLQFLLTVGLSVNATPVDEFPTVQQRLGAPATGLGNFPTPSEPGRRASLEEFVSAVFARHLDGLVRADLHRRATGSDDLAEINGRLGVLGRDLRGLATVLEPSWREATEELLAGVPYATAAEVEAPTAAVIDRLVGAARAPRLGDVAADPAAEQLLARAVRAASILGERCGALRPGHPDDAWLAALSTAEQLGMIAHVAAPLLPKKARRHVAELTELVADLRGCSEIPGRPDLTGVDPEEAYLLGVEAERARRRVLHRRRAFLKAWPGRVAAQGNLLEKLKGKSRG